VHEALANVCEHAYDAGVGPCRSPSSRSDGGRTAVIRACHPRPADVPGRGLVHGVTPAWAWQAMQVAPSADQVVVTLTANPSKII
jgi:hypothetical protein